MTPGRESRPARRARQRREAKRPRFITSFASRTVFITGEGMGRSPAQRHAPKSSGPTTWSDTRYLLFCRAEDEDGDGFHVITGADSPEDGDWLARELQPIVRPELSMRCELVANTAAAITAWARQSVQRRQALAQFGENWR